MVVARNRHTFPTREEVGWPACHLWMVCGVWRIFAHPFHCRLAVHDARSRGPHRTREPEIMVPLLVFGQTQVPTLSICSMPWSSQ